MLLASRHARRVGTLLAVGLGVALGGCSLIIGADFHSRDLASGGSSSASGGAASTSTTGPGGGTGGQCSNAGGGGAGGGPGTGGGSCDAANPNPIWTKQIVFQKGIGSTGLPRLVERDGRVTMVGNFGTIAGDAIQVDKKSAVSAGGGDVFLVELDSATGTARSVRAFGDSNVQFAFGLDVTSDNSLLVGGQVTGKLAFGCTDPLLAGQDTDPFLALLDPRGNATRSELLNAMGTTPAIVAVAAGTPATGNGQDQQQLYATGSFKGTLDIDGTPIDSGASTQGFLVRYDSSLTLKSSNIISTTGVGSITPQAIAFSEDGGAVIGGDFEGILPKCVPTDSNTVCFTVGKSAFVTRYTFNATAPQWIEGLKSAGDLAAIAVGPTGTTALVRDGLTSMTLDLLDKTGAVQKEISIDGATGYAAAFQISQGMEAELFVAGSMTTEAIQKACKVASPMAFAGIFVASFDVVQANCNWIRAYKGSSASAVTLSMDPGNGVLFVGGIFADPLTLGSQTLTPGTKDAFVASFCLPPPTTTSP